MFVDPRLPAGPVVRRGRNPLEVTLLAVFVLSSIAGLFAPGDASPTLTRLLGEYTWTWHVGLLIGSVTSLIAVVFLKPLNDVLIERAGMVWLSSCFLAYGVAAVFSTSLLNTGAAIVLGLGIGFGARAWQITSDLRRLHRILKDLPHREGPVTE